MPLNKPAKIPQKKRPAIKVWYDGINFDIMLNTNASNTTQLVSTIEFFLPRKSATKPELVPPIIPPKGYSPFVIVHAVSSSSRVKHVVLHEVCI